ncbi:uncharacterized protein FOMMEDRAFT_144283 [Fomitiporia mediterranea MF3/22]|uniref:uncharacterized protein n=1 Tax=Fomitiporia mediterranea (strain MF3/22) TaxID=694068 RepID=UPI0004407BCB|nr:uncharacterized protein FOMMEDRAFT_144283 [Fomitiporia mediterranea MF3/22]EJD08321.1 hypothetical protein FOMMEDRAFT_144283 [Fomitiporia mediterranea MF3/22]
MVLLLRSTVKKDRPKLLGWHEATFPVLATPLYAHTCPMNRHGSDSDSEASEDHLNLKGQLSRKRNKSVSTGAYRDISRGKCNVEGRGKIKVAIKCLRFYLEDDIKLLFEKEVYVWSKLKHNNILPLLGYDFNKATGYPLLVSEWMDNRSAWAYVRLHPEANVMHLVSGIAQGLAYLHEKDVVHSDIKSDNILVSDSSEALICDFGCSRMLVASRTFVNPTSGLRGTSSYLAYELVAEQHSSGHTKQTDVWAFRMTVFELLTRKRPFEGLSDVQAIVALQNYNLPAFPEVLATKVSAKESEILKTICWSSWKQRPSERPSMTDASELCWPEYVYKSPALYVSSAESNTENLDSVISGDRRSKQSPTFNVTNVTLPGASSQRISLDLLKAVGGLPDYAYSSRASFTTGSPARPFTLPDSICPPALTHLSNARPFTLPESVCSPVLTDLSNGKLSSDSMPSSNAASTRRALSNSADSASSPGYVHGEFPGPVASTVSTQLLLGPPAQSVGAALATMITRAMKTNSSAISPDRSPKRAQDEQKPRNLLVCNTCGEGVPSRDPQSGGLTLRLWHMHQDQCRLQHDPRPIALTPDTTMELKANPPRKKRPPLRKRRAKRAEEERIEYLRSDPYVVQFEPYRVLCGSCNKWVRLQPYRTYCSKPWDAHRKSCISKKAALPFDHRSPDTGIAPPGRSTMNLVEPSYNTKSHASAPSHGSLPAPEAFARIANGFSYARTVRSVLINGIDAAASAWHGTNVDRRRFPATRPMGRMTRVLAVMLVMVHPATTATWTQMAHLMTALNPKTDLILVGKDMKTLKGHQVIHTRRPLPLRLGNISCRHNQQQWLVTTSTTHRRMLYREAPSVDDIRDASMDEDAGGEHDLDVEMDEEPGRDRRRQYEYVRRRPHDNHYGRSSHQNHQRAEDTTAKADLRSARLAFIST